MFLKDGGKVALMSGNLCSQEGAVGQAQEHLNPKAELCITIRLGFFGKDIYPPTAQHQGSTTRCGEHLEIFVWKMFARRTHWECPGLPSSFPSITRSCWRAGGQDGTRWCHADDSPSEMEGNMLLPQNSQCPQVNPVPSFQGLIRLGTVQTCNRGDSVRYRRWHARRGQHTQGGR